jgi:hypothetical protein
MHDVELQYGLRSTDILTIIQPLRKCRVNPEVKETRNPPSTLSQQFQPEVSLTILFVASLHHAQPFVMN